MLIPDKKVENGYEVSYTPMAPGKYYVTVKYNGKNVAGSPYACYVDGENLTGDDAQTGTGIIMVHGSLITCP